MVMDEKVNILLVDDRPENLLALEAIIERNDCQLIKATSGEEALIQLLKHDFATILLDVQMPGVDGFATAKIIKAREKTKNIPIIFITANNMNAEHIFTGYSLGAIEYLIKPFDPIILRSKVDRFVEMYKMNQKLIKQADILAEKTKELEKAYQKLTSITTELRESEALANVISETSIDSMIVIDEEGMILKVNPAVKSMFYYNEEEIVGKSIRLLFPSDQTTYIKSILEASSGLASSNVKEVTAARKEGSSFPAEIQIGKRYIKNKIIVACTIRDVTSKKQTQELITHMAYHDGLTNLPNRRLFNDQLNKQLNVAKQNNKPFAILYLDIDRFKFINDSLGHQLGDKMLQEISKRLVESVRINDFVARIGGDEFNVILPDTNRESAIEIAEIIMKSTKDPFHFEHYELFITTSIGMSVFPYDGEDSLVLIKNADAALYHAKEQGKNKLKIYHSGMNMLSYRAFVLQNDLRKAVEQGELLLYFQPRFNLETGAVHSAEALLRWNHPNWGTIMPSEFIPLAEQTGQIFEIGDWVIESACKQCKIWQQSGRFPIRVAVNLSPMEFIQIDLINKINSAVTEAGIRHDQLEIEITESTLMGNEEGITNILRQIRKMGITISIDDFGTGYSSLNYLRRFPMDTLKIDKSFVQDINRGNPDSMALISSIISLAASLKMSVIAEGVETEEQLNVLKMHGCKEIQGYLICPPIPSEEFEAFLWDNLPETSFSNPKNNTPSVAHQEMRITDIHITALNIHNELSLDQNQDILNAAIRSTKELYSISSREIEVFELIVEGLSNREISDKLFISENAVKNHITHIFQKLNVTDRLQAMSKIYQTCMDETQKLRTR
jgi:diguanylate cyclase (GGDEF)-like protein/PAS domain S-box-containing protein